MIPLIKNVNVIWLTPRMFTIWIATTLVVPLNRCHSNQVSNAFFPNVLGTLANNHYITSLSKIKFLLKSNKIIAIWNSLNDCFHKLILLECDDVIVTNYMYAACTGYVTIQSEWSIICMQHVPATSPSRVSDQLYVCSMYRLRHHPEWVTNCMFAAHTGYVTIQI